MIPANWKMPKASANPSWIASAGAESRNENADERTITVPLSAMRTAKISRTVNSRQRFLFQMNAMFAPKRRNAVHRKFTILLSATCTTRLMISGFPSAVFARMMISVAVRGPSFMVASVSTDVTPWMSHCCSSAASFS